MKRTRPIPRPARPASTLLLVLMLAVGCDGRPAADASRAEATVTGVVKLRGKPFGSGKIVFYGSNIERQEGGAAARIGPDGSYSVRAFAGTNAVVFAGDAIARDRTLQAKKRIINLDAGANVKDFDLGTPADEGQGPSYPAGAKQGVQRKLARKAG